MAAIGTCASLSLLLPAPAGAQDVASASLIETAISALRAGHDVAYDDALSELESSGEWLPDRTWQAFEDRNERMLELSQQLLETADPELMLLALAAIQFERDAVRALSSGVTVDLFNAQRIDAEGELHLEVIDRRGIVIQQATRVLLGPIPGDLATDPPPMTEYEDVIGVLAGRLGVTLPPAVWTSHSDAATEPPTANADGPSDSETTPVEPGAGGSSTGITPATLGLAAIALLGLGISIVAMGRGRRNERLADLAFTDGLTGLNNRRRFDNDIAAQTSHSARPTAVLMLDVDHFKKFNDTYGHALGDEVLRQVGNVIARTVRASDVGYRYGGEEFSVLLPDCSADDAHAVGLRLAEAIRQIRVAVADGGTTSVTASLGLACGVAQHSSQLVEQADQAMYVAKETGRNRLVAI